MGSQKFKKALTQYVGNDFSGYDIEKECNFLILKWDYSINEITSIYEDDTDTIPKIEL
jgi:hypothetical protein